MEEMNLLIAGVTIAMISPWIFLLIYMQDRKRAEVLWRETLVYLKSSSAFEAEDTIDRVHQRQKSLLAKGIAKIKKEDENLSEDASVDMAQDMRQTLGKKYGTEA